MRLPTTLKLLLLPAPANSYRPWALQKNTVAFFLAVVLVSEGLFVSSLFNANPSQLFLGAVAAAPVPAQGQGAVGQIGQGLKALATATGYPLTTTNLVLAGVILILLGIIAAAVLMHLHIQPGDLMLPALVVVGIALVLLALNLWYGGAYAIA